MARQWQQNPDHVPNFSIPGYTDLGWQLHWDDSPELKACYESGHKRRVVDNSLYLFRSTNRIHICDECRNYYHIDSSD
jgi:hypothetical protein